MNRHNGMRPQDVAVLLKVIIAGKGPWLGRDLAQALHLSAAEVSYSLRRSAIAGLYDPVQRKVSRRALLDFLRSGLPYVFPQRPGSIVRGVPTAHSAPPLALQISGVEPYVWPSAKGTVRGQAIEPLYSGAIDAALEDEDLHQLLALVDALRVGRVRERELAMQELRKKLK